jgi:putative ABC transport system permease protein
VKGYLSDVVMEVGDPETHEKAVMQVRRALGRLHHFEPTDKDALFIWDTLDGSEILARIFGVITIFFACVAVVTLALCGIGVMNIMMVAVTERTREIGVLRAIGATKLDIIKQFFAESVVISVLSGIIGYCFGIGVCVLMSSVPLPDFVPHPIVSPVAVVASLVTLSLITMGAGLYPARRAAEMDPVECLHYE